MLNLEGMIARVFVVLVVGAVIVVLAWECRRN
jgi:hypothetical protein